MMDEADHSISNASVEIHGVCHSDSSLSHEWVGAMVFKLCTPRLRTIGQAAAAGRGSATIHGGVGPCPTNWHSHTMPGAASVDEG